MTPTPITDPDSFTSRSYDYVIIGGGTAGLTLAARLTEDSNVSVGVIEAGQDNTDDPKVLVPGLVTSQLDIPEYDWCYRSTPQKDANGVVLGLPRGKGLGGSSALNYMYQTHASRGDLDDWVELGNEGWSWKDVFPYFLKSERFILPDEQVARDLDVNIKNFDPELHGKDGPICAGFPKHYSNFQKLWPKTFDTLGLHPTTDPKGGLALGGFTNPLVHDVDKAQRSFSGNGYWKPNAHRSNLRVVTKALVHKIVFDKNPDGQLIATGVYFEAEGKFYTTKVTKEVLLCAGTFASSQILELSGIGNRELLTSHGIGLLYENANVGENLQDHTICPLTFEVNDGLITNDDFLDPAFSARALSDYNEHLTGPLVAGITSSALLSYAQVVGKDPPPQDLPSYSQLHPGFAEQHALTLRKLSSPHESLSQHLFTQGGWDTTDPSLARGIFSGQKFPGRHFVTMEGVITHPFSRGTVHITSPDVHDLAAVDPAYLSHPLDVQLYKHIMLFCQKIARTEPFIGLLKDGGHTFQPDMCELTSANAEEHVRRFINTEYHPIGTCAMQPREKGGVVDPRLRVYGTRNLRVVDASIFPLHVQANIVSLVYAVAEKAADLIKEDARK